MKIQPSVPYIAVDMAAAILSVPAIQFGQFGDNALFIATERNKKDTEVKFDFFDEQFNHLPLRQGHPNSSLVIERPSCFETMKGLASKLSKDFPHVRVDFYEIDGQVYFGEMTFFHNAGWVKFDPLEWDNIFGNWLTLPENKII